MKRRITEVEKQACLSWLRMDLLLACGEVRTN